LEASLNDDRDDSDGGDFDHLFWDADDTLIDAEEKETDWEDHEFDDLFQADDEEARAPGDDSNLFEDQHGDKVRWGGASVYKVTDPDTGAKTVVAVPQHVHYAHRGPKLQQLCLLEYACVIEVIVKPSGRGASEEGRKRR